MKSTILEEKKTPEIGLPLRVLFLEHSREDVELALHELRQAGFHVLPEIVENREQFLQSISRQTYDAVLSAHHLPDWTGPEAFGALRDSGKDIPFILVSGTLGEEAAVECIKQGISDFVLKGHLSRLGIALQRAIGERTLRDAAAQAQDALAESESRARQQFAELELLYRALPVALVIYDREMRFVRVNEALAKVTGLPVNEHAGKRLREIAPDFAEPVETLLERVFATGEPIVNVELSGAMRLRPEEQRVWLASFYALRSESGEITAVSTVGVDITERKRAAESVRLSEERYRTLVENAPEAIVLLNLDTGHFTDANRNAEQLFGCSREALSRLGPADLSPPLQGDGRSSAEAASEYIRAALHGDTRVFEWTHRNGAGEEIACEIRLVRLPSAAGNLIRASITDIRERKRAEEELRLLEARNRDLVENTVYGICRTTPEGVLLDANPALARMIACAAIEEACGLHLQRDVFRFPEQWLALLASCRERGSVAGAEHEWRRLDGVLITVRLSLRHVRSPGAADVIEVIAEDVTELRTMERQLRQAQKFEAIGQLAGGIAHDFNNVVGAILGWAELGFDEARATPQVAQRFARIREQADRAAALTRELLAFARRQVLQPRPVDLNEVVNGLVSFLDKVIGKDIEIQVNQAAELERVRADPTQIEQVLMNLCLNARDAMPDGGRLLLETEIVELDEGYSRFYSYAVPGRYALLSVSDTGMGMAAETRERIFEPFFTTKELGKGTGLGLATVYGIVKQHGGFIHVYSEPGQGSLFRVYLPLMQGTIPDAERKLLPSAAIPVVGGTETILLAEDHDAIREMARQSLTKLGYRVLCAQNGEEAVSICEKETPALAILDMVMPKLGGAATAAKLIARLPNLSLLFTSGYFTDPSAVSPPGAEVRFLQKPYSPSALGRLVREVLDQSKKPKEQAAP